MTNNRKSVSIILNCYNGSAYLKEALLSVKNQTFNNWELIFWDNRSTDNSKEILFNTINKKNLNIFYQKNIQACTQQEIWR